MDWKAFIASIVGSLAWPTVIVVLLIVLRQQIVGLAERLQELTLPGGAKATFEKQLEAARHEVENLPPAPAEPGTGRLVPEPAERKFLRLVITSPEAAVIEAYRRIETVLSEIATQLRMENTENPVPIMEELVKRGLIDGPTLDLFNTLRKARNVAAHVRPGRITPDEALDYGEHTDTLSGRLHYVFGQLEVRQKQLHPEGATTD